MESSDYDIDVHPQRNPPSTRFGATFNPLQASPPSNLLALRKKARVLLTCPPQEAAECIMQECQFLIKKTRTLSEQSRKLHDKRLAGLTLIKDNCKATEQLYQELISIFSEKIQKWFKAQRNGGFEQASKSRGAPLLQEIKKLESQYDHNMQQFKTLSPSLFIENLQKQNAEMKKLLEDPQLANKKSPITREITLLKEQFERNMNRAYLSREQADANYNMYTNHMVQMMAKSEGSSLNQEMLGTLNFRFKICSTLLETSKKKKEMQQAQLEKLLTTYTSSLLDLIYETDRQDSILKPLYEEIRSV